MILHFSLQKVSGRLQAADFKRCVTLFITPYKYEGSHEQGLTLTAELLKDVSALFRVWPAGCCYQHH